MTRRRSRDPGGRAGRGWRLLTAAVLMALLAGAAAWTALRSDSSESQPAQPPRRPAVGAFPDGSTTGVPSGTRLKRSAGRKVTKRGAVLDRLDVSGPVIIAAQDVVIRRSRIKGTGDYGIIVRSGSVRIEDSEISGFQNGIGFDNWTAIRVNVHSVAADGFKLGSNVVLADSWCHELTPAPGAHADCVQMQNGVVNTIVRGNNLDPSNGDRLGNAALFIRPKLGPSAAGPLTVTGNLLGGGNYSLYCVDGDPFVVDNILIAGNKFKRNARFGPHVTNVPVTWRDNTWLDDGTSVDL